MVLVTNLLKNGDFSQGDEGWIIESPDHAQIITDPDSNKCYLKLMDSMGEKHYAVKQTVSVKPNQRYDLIAEVFYLQGKGKIWRKRQKESGSRSSSTSSSEPISFNEETLIDEREIIGNWRMHFFTDADVSQLDIAFTAVSDSPSEEFIAGISEVFLYEHNLVQNGDFSQGLPPWETRLSHPTNSKVQLINNALQITLGAGASQKIADIQPNTGYRLTFKNCHPYQGENGSVTITANLASGNENLVSQDYENRGWEYQTIEFDTPDSEIGEIEISLWSDNTGQFDDFALAPIKRPALL